MKEVKLKVVVDVQTKQVGCVLLQALYGGSSAVASMFDTRHWVLAPNDNLRIVEGTLTQWQAHAKKLDNEGQR